MDHDGLDDIVLPVSLGIAIYHQQREGEGEGTTPGKWPARPDRLLPCAMASRVSVDAPGLTGSVRGELGVPDILEGDFTGDGRPDLALEDVRTLQM